jgi:hypothetical protein
MSRVRRALNLVVLLGAVAPAVTGCTGAGGAGGLLLNAILAVGVSVGIYYLTQELT